MIVAGIAALAAAFVWLYNKFTPVQVIADWFGNQLVKAIDDTIAAFSKLFEWIGVVLSPLADLFGGTTKVEGSLTTAVTQIPKVGPPAGFGRTIDAAARSTMQKNENHVLVEFANPPAGTTVEAKKADGGLDLSMGWGLAGGMP